MSLRMEKIVFNSVLNFRRVTHFRLCLLETQVVCKAQYPWMWYCIALSCVPPFATQSRWTENFWSKNLMLKLKKEEEKKNFFGKADSFWGFEFCWGLLNQLPCIVGELAGGGSLAVAVGDKRGVTYDMRGKALFWLNFLVIFWYWCYYPHKSRDSITR